MVKRTAWACDYCNTGVEYTHTDKMMVEDHEKAMHSGEISRRALNNLITEVRRALRDGDESRLSFLEERTDPRIWEWVMSRMEEESRRGGATRVRFCVKGQHDKCGGYWRDGLRCACGCGHG